MPEAHQETSRKNALAFLLGIGAILGVTRLAHELGLTHAHTHESPGHDGPGHHERDHDTPGHDEPHEGDRDRR